MQLSKHSSYKHCLPKQNVLPIHPWFIEQVFEAKHYKEKKMRRFEFKSITSLTNANVLKVVC